MKKVSVIGLGYIGLPTAIVAAQAGLKVHGYDIDARRVEAINAGVPLIQEPDLLEKLATVLQQKTFFASTELVAADYLVIAVPTPFTHDKNPNLSYLFSALESVALVLQQGNTVIIESTIPVGATEQAASYLEKITGMCAGKDFFVAHCPERVLPGKIFKELVENARVVGGITSASAQAAADFYSYFVQGQVHLTDAKTAEMVKLVENSSRDVQLAFAHQVAQMAQAAQIDPFTVIALANKHPRVHILQPSAGVGGHCIAVDPWFLVSSFPEQTALLRCAREVNDARPHQVVSMIKKLAVQWRHAHGRACTIALLGLTYKPNSDDMRESPAVEIARELCAFNPRVMVVEPHSAVHNLPAELSKRLVSQDHALAKADLIVFVVAHKEFANIDKRLLENKIMFDVCGITKGESYEAHSFISMSGVHSRHCESQS